jgi:hypothetical protein
VRQVELLKRCVERAGKDEAPEWTRECLDLGTGADRRLSDAERKIGELTMENEILRRAAEKRGLQIPPPKRPR